MKKEEIYKAKEYLSCGFDKKRSTEKLPDETVIAICESMERNTQRIFEKLTNGE